MYRVKYFNNVGQDRRYSNDEKIIENQINNFLASNPNVIPISISSARDGCSDEVYMLYKIDN